MLDISFIDNIFVKKKIRSIFASKTRCTFVIDQYEKVSDIFLILDIYTIQILAQISLAVSKVTIHQSNRSFRIVQSYRTINFYHRKIVKLNPMRFFHRSNHHFFHVSRNKIPISS